MCEGNQGAPSQESSTKSNDISLGSRIDTIEEDLKEGEADDDEGLPTYPYERLTILSMDPVTEIDVTKREVCFK